MSSVNLLFPLGQEKWLGITLPQTVQFLYSKKLTVEN